MPSSQPQGYAQHPELGEVAYRIDPVSADPEFQVAQTIERMRSYACEDVGDPYLRMDAIAAGASGDPIGGIWNLIRQRMTFKEDEENAGDVPIGGAEIAEVLIRPRDVARTMGCYGDCDCQSMMCAALLLANGIGCAFCTIAADGEDPSRYSHVYVVAYPTGADGRSVRVPMDCSHGPYPGWESPIAFRKREWPLVESASILSWLSMGLSLWGLLRLGAK